MKPTIVTIVIDEDDDNEIVGVYAGAKNNARKQMVELLMDYPGGNEMTKRQATEMVNMKYTFRTFPIQ